MAGRLARSLNACTHREVVTPHASAPHAPATVHYTCLKNGVPTTGLSYYSSFDEFWVCSWESDQSGQPATDTSYWHACLGPGCARASEAVDCAKVREALDRCVVRVRREKSCVAPNVDSAVLHGATARYVRSR